jgi:hypothetical protein
MNIKTCKYLQAEEEPRLDFYCYYYHMGIIVIIRGESSLITRTNLGTKISGSVIILFCFSIHLRAVSVVMVAPCTCIP